MGIFDDFFNKKQSRLVNLDWLEVKPEDYENLPFNDIPEYVAIPKLEEAWKHKDQNPDMRLVPNSEFNFNYNTPSKQENIDDEVSKLVTFIKKQMMSGKTGSDLLEVIKSKVTPRVLKAATEELKKLSKEQGLLGHVYVDPTVFKSCSDGSKFLEKRSKTATYVKAMSPCSSCVFNDCGRCSIYKRKLASDINYDEVLPLYSKHFTNVTGKQVTIQNKDELQRRFIEKKATTRKVAESKPSMDEKEEKTLEKKKQELQENIEGIKENLSKMINGSIYKDISQLLIKKYSSKDIKDYIKARYSRDIFEKNKDAFNSLFEKQGSLGTVFVEAKSLPQDEKGLVDFINKHTKDVDYVVDTDQAKKASDNPLVKTCRRLNKQIVSSYKDIPKTAYDKVFYSYPENIVEKIKPLYEKDVIKGIRLAHIQKQLTATKSNVKAFEDFNLKYKVASEIHNPNKKEAKLYFSSENIKYALKKGHALSAIVKIGSKSGLKKKAISEEIKKALGEMKEIHSYQVDIDFELPENVKTVVSEKDRGLSLNPEIKKSTSAPIENCLNDYDIKESSLNIEKDIKQYSNDLEISGLNVFNIE